MGGEVRIVFEEDGYPRELINAHDYERAIREGALTPDMDITVYRDDQAPSVFRARRVKELKPLFGIGKRASVRPAREKSASPPELVLEPGAPQGKPAKRTAVAATAAMPAPIESLEAPREPVSAEPPRAWDVEEALALEELGARRDGPSLVKFFLRALRDQVRESVRQANHRQLLMLGAAVLAIAVAMTRCSANPAGNPTPVETGSAGKPAIVTRIETSPVRTDPRTASPTQETKAGDGTSAASRRGARAAATKPPSLRRDRAQAPITQASPEVGQIECVMPSGQVVSMTRAVCTANAGSVY